MKNFSKIFTCLILLLFTACTPKEINFEEIVLVLQSESMQLKEHKPDNKAVYVLARQDESRVDDLQAALEQSIRLKGYDITTNPSNAGYIIHVAIPAMGSFSEDDLLSIIKAGYGEDIKQKAYLNDDDKQFAIVADVLAVARFIPKEVRRRPAVVTTTSKPSILAENSTRIITAIPEDDDYTTAQARAYLVQNIANKVVTSLP